MNAKAKGVSDYLRKHNLHDSHWGEIIIDAAERGSFTLEEVNDANCWPTCACGMSVHDFETLSPNAVDDWVGKDAPVDDRLRRLGEGFAGEVRNNYFMDAAHVLVRIEERAAELDSQLQPRIPT